jgi:hypothetical protein
MYGEVAGKDGVYPHALTLPLAALLATPSSPELTKMDMPCTPSFIASVLKEFMTEADIRGSGAPYDIEFTNGGFESAATWVIQSSNGVSSLESYQ